MLRIHALLLLAFLAAAPAFAIEPVTLQLKWRNAFQFAGYYTALWKGYYRDAGFDVTIREAEPGQSVVDEVVADCLRSLRTKHDVKFLGSYPAAGPAGETVRDEAEANRIEADAWVESLRGEIIEA